MRSKMDIDTDQAYELQDLVMRSQIQNIRNNVGRSLLPSGYCYYCGEEIHSPLIFCDALCRDDYEKEEYLRKIAGRVE